MGLPRFEVEPAAPRRPPRRADLVQQAVASLPPKQRSVVVLRYYQGLSSAEIADVMQRTTKAIERLLARGRKTLQERLSRLLE